MAVAEPKTDVPGITRPMTYEEYMAGPEEMARYDILDGWKVYRLYGDNLMPSPTRRHQRILGRLLRSFQDYEMQTGSGEVIAAPSDVQITYQPLRSRQPDIIFIGNDRLAQNLPAEEYGPLALAPELVLEILSPSDTNSVLAAKIADYRSVDVREIWLVRAVEQMVDVMTLIDDSIQTYGPGETALSLIFPGMAVTIDTIFQE